MMRWSEEVVLLQEEMRQILETCRWEMRDWARKGAESVDSEDQGINEGQAAYARRQVLLRLKWINRCEYLWRNIPELLARGASALEDDQIILPTLDNDGKLVAVKEPREKNSRGREDYFFD